MREILFRGKTIDSDEWVEGSLVNNIFFYKKDDSPIFYIATIDNEECEDIDCWEDMTDGYGYYGVKPETVGQYTGLQDKNGKKIFEGDVVYGENYLFPVIDKRNLAIRFDKESAGFQMNVMCLEDLEVIGNIYDNPELLEGEQ